MDVLGSENVRLGFYFADLIFVVCPSTMKTAKIGSIENFRLFYYYIGVNDLFKKSNLCNIIIHGSFRTFNFYQVLNSIWGLLT